MEKDPGDGGSQNLAAASGTWGCNVQPAVPRIERAKSYFRHCGWVLSPCDSSGDSPYRWTLIPPNSPYTIYATSLNALLRAWRVVVSHNLRCQQDAAGYWHLLERCNVRWRTSFMAARLEEEGDFFPTWEIEAAAGAMLEEVLPLERALGSVLRQALSLQRIECAQRISVVGLLRKREAERQAQDLIRLMPNIDNKYVRNRL